MPTSQRREGMLLPHRAPEYVGFDRFAAYCLSKAKNIRAPTAEQWAEKHRRERWMLYDQQATERAALKEDYTL